MIAAELLDTWKNPIIPLPGQPESLPARLVEDDGNTVMFFDLTAPPVVIRYDVASAVSLTQQITDLYAIGAKPIIAKGGVPIFQTLVIPTVEDAQVAAFLIRHPEIIPLIAPAREAFQRAFDGARVTLQVDTTFDPDYSENRDELAVIAWVRPPYDADHIIQRLNAFYDEWIPNHLGNEDRAMRFDVGIE